MKIVCISDTHNRHRKLEIPEGDVLIHAGDATMSGKPRELFPFIEWMGKQPHAVKLFVPGNHDFDVEKNIALYKRVCRENGVYLLIDEPIRIGEEKLVVYGTPWVPNLSGWAFYGDSVTLAHRFGRIPDGTQVLITHGPPEGTLDVGPAGNAYHIGSAHLALRVGELPDLKLHVFGHIHQGYGQKMVSRLRCGNDTEHLAVNAAICTEEYEPTNKPIVVEV